MFQQDDREFSSIDHGKRIDTAVAEPRGLNDVMGRHGRFTPPRLRMDGEASALGAHTESLLTRFAAKDGHQIDLTMLPKEKADATLAMIG